MSIFANGLVAAMEDETQTAELAIDSTGADSAEADIVEATDISADVEAGTAEIDQASADAETLTRIADTAEAAEADGGLDPVAAEVTEIAVEAIYARLGVKHTSYPALESFAGRSGRVRATRIAVEDIKETVKKIWAAVVNAFHKIIDFIGNLFNKMFDVNRKLSARINKLQSEVKSAKGVPEGKIKSHSITKGARATDKAGVISNIGGVNAEVKTLVDDRIKSTSYLALTVKDVSVAVKDAEGKDVGFLDKSKAISDLYEEAKKIEGYASKFKIIGSSIDAKFATEGGDSLWDKMKDFGVTIKQYLPGTEKEEIDALSLQECSKVLESARGIVQNNLNLKPAIEKIKSNIKHAIDEAQSIADKLPADAEGSSKVSEDMRVAQRVIQNTGSSEVKLVTFAGKLAMEMAKAGIDYVERSLGNVGSGGKKQEEKK